MNLLVTGAAGFIGSHYVLRHVAANPEDTVVVIDKLTYAGDRSLLAPVEDKITFVEKDFIDRDVVEHIVDKFSIETIVDFAAETHVDRSIGDSAPFLHTNVLGVENMIAACRVHPEILYLHVSTDEVYGDQQDDDPACTPESPLWPSNPYSASKAAGDLLILAAIRTYGIRARITRCTNNYGPHQDSEKLLPVILRNAMQDKPIPIYGEGKQMRDWLYVTDHTDAIELVLEKGEDGKIYNISAENEKQNIEVARQAVQALGKSEDLITFVEDRPGHDWRYKLDPSSIQELGWEAKVGFEEGLKETIEWYKNRA